MTPTFAPPTGPPVTGSPVSPIDDVEPVPATSPPNRRRLLTMIAAAVAVVALGGAAFVALAGGRSGDAAEPYSLAAAAENTVSARTVEFDLTVSTSDVGSLSVNGTFDNESQLVSMSTDLSSLLGLGDVPMPLGAGEVTVLVDGSEGVVYLDASVLGGFLPADAAWVSIDLGALAELSGQSLDDLRGELGIDPTEIARSLIDSDNATVVGMETIDGVEVEHYVVTVDLAEALASLPGSQIDPALADVELPDTVAFDVWVSADNQLRRIAFDTSVAGRSISMQLDMSASDEPADVELPAESEVFDLTDLLGS